jgi:hypothetical protein
MRVGFATTKDHPMSQADEPQRCPQCAGTQFTHQRVSRLGHAIALSTYMVVGIWAAVAIIGMSDMRDPYLLLLFPLNIVSGLVFWWRNLRRTTPQTISCHKCGYSVTATQSPSGK